MCTSSVDITTAYPTESSTNFKMKLGRFTYKEVLTIAALSSVFTFMITSCVYFIVHACICGVKYRCKKGENIEVQEHDTSYEDVTVIHRASEMQRFDISENIAYGPSKISSTSSN